MTAAEDQLLAGWTADAAIWAARTGHLWSNQKIADAEAISISDALSAEGLIESYADRKVRLAKKTPALTQPQPVMRPPQPRRVRRPHETGCKPGSQRAISRANRQAAIEARQNTYLGAVCKYGHRPGLRFVLRNDCCQCSRLRHQRPRLMFPRGTWHSVETVDGARRD